MGIQAINPTYLKTASIQFSRIFLLHFSVQQQPNENGLN